MTSILIQNGLVITMDAARTIGSGSIYIEAERIHAFPSTQRSADIVIDASDMLVLPGFVQTHVHLCQVLFRGLADDMDVIDWLRLRIWPLEQAHDTESLYDSARLGVAEMLRSGTTCALTMETVHHTEAAFQAVIDAGFRSITGKVMMDRWEVGTEMIGEQTEDALRESLRLLDEFHGQADGRVSYALCPCGTRNCTDGLWQDVKRAADKRGVLIHTHAAENKMQTERLTEEGGTEVRYLHGLGVTGRNLVLAHSIWLDDEELDLLAQTGTKVAHCPSANMKLASGFARIPEMLERGVDVGLGADGAPCNNNLDMFHEMRLASLIHKPRYGPRSMPAGKILEMATIGGAKVLGMDKLIGSIEVGKLADIILVRRDGLHNQPIVESNPVSQLVYQHQASDVDTVIVNGKVLLRHGKFTELNLEDVCQRASSSIQAVLKRADIKL